MDSNGNSHSTCNILPAKMKNRTHTLTANLWKYQGEAPWHFVTIENVIADELKKDWPWPRRGFGSIPVEVTIGKSKWKTSVFPEKKGTFLLPIKKEIRVKEELFPGQKTELHIRVLS